MSIKEVLLKTSIQELFEDSSENLPSYLRVGGITLLTGGLVKQNLLIKMCEIAQAHSNQFSFCSPVIGNTFKDAEELQKNITYLITALYKDNETGIKLLQRIFSIISEILLLEISFYKIKGVNSHDAVMEILQDGKVVNILESYNSVLTIFRIVSEICIQHFCFWVKTQSLNAKDYFDFPYSSNGIVFIDSIENGIPTVYHSNILPTLVKYFEDVCFVCTTDSPLVLTSVSVINIFEKNVLKLKGYDFTCYKVLYESSKKFLSVESIYATFSPSFSADLGSVLKWLGATEQHPVILNKLKNIEKMIYDFSKNSNDSSIQKIEEALEELSYIVDPNYCFPLGLQKTVFKNKIILRNLSKTKEKG